MSTPEKEKVDFVENMSIEHKDDRVSDKSKKVKEKKPKEPSVSIIKLFRFATIPERMLVIAAILCSAGAGALQPLSILIYGQFINGVTATTDPSTLLEATMPAIRIMLAMATVSLFTGYISNCLWVITGEKQTRRIRSLFLHSVLNQNMGWFDAAEEGSLNNRLAADTQIVKDGISEKFGQFVSLFAQFFAGFLVAFLKGWKLTLIILAVFPLVFGILTTMDHFISKYAVASQKSFADAGSIAEQAFHSIRTVYSFTLQSRFSARYAEKLEEACDSGVRRGVTTGLGMASFMLVQFCSFSLTLWYGTKLVIDGQMTGPEVFVVYIAMLIGCMSFLKLPPNLTAVVSAKGVAYKLFQIIDRVPDINPDATDGLTLSEFKGTIEFKDVCFKYPTRPDLQVLDNVNIKIEPGMTVAFVGPSGSGKSTTVQLVQRFYDTLSGQVTMDGHDVKDLNVKWLRQQIGVVSQEPVLFNMTVRQNLLMGVQKEVSQNKIIASCKEANCHGFITQLPDGYDTIVGEQGGMLSGGQKQRIAIARAILKNSPILILDEATSALDTQSERLVQSALSRASVSRTTIVVAHRLSTIKNADLIVVLSKGHIIEQGTHETLVSLKGTYASLVEKQAIDVGENGVSDQVKNKEEDLDDLLRQEELEFQKNLEEKDNDLLDRDSNSTIDIPSDKLEKSQGEINVYELKVQEAKRIRKERSKQSTPLKRVLLSMRNEWAYIACGVISATLAGCIFPVYTLIFCTVVTILSTPNTDLHFEPMKGTNLYAFLFVILAIASFLAHGGQILCFEVSGEKFSKRFRIQVFEAYLKQEVGFFDCEENNTGELTTRLSVDARNVNEMITKIWGDCAQVFSSIVSGCVIAFTNSWALSLITIALSPLMSIATAYEYKIQKDYETGTKKLNAQSGHLAGEAIREVRTVAALNKQNYFEERYFDATEHAHKLSIRKAFLSSIAAGVSKGGEMYISAIGFYVGTKLIMNGSITFQQMFTSMTVIITAAESAGRCSTFASTFSKAKFAAIASFEVIDRQPEIDPELEGIEPPVGSIQGDIDFKNIKFAYPARPEISIFDGNFNISGKAGQTIALVGPSGCGKSTTIGMLQRWYDPSSGSVSLDENNVKSFSLYNLRSHMSIVGQEPVLFDMTIGENIRYGVVDGEELFQEQVDAACKSANIYDFITSMPDGYNTRVGDKGSQISGGQKQRIAIARALIRKPKVLLLDEATSALDSESEKLVQEALDNILQEGGRTTITIAHRLSTIKNVDLICVVKPGGIVVEQGTHWELLKLNGVYSEMVNQQSLSIL